MSDQKQYMLLFSLGPVQSFIAQARKTRDLWLGSFLLSMMMEAAMKGLEGKLVYPTNPTLDKDIPDLPNKFVAIFDDENPALAAAEKSKKAIDDLWNIIREEVWDAIIHGAQSPEDEKITRAIWDQQSEPGRFCEIFWVVAEESPKGYKQWLKSAQDALDARKRFRDFDQQVELGDKSNISYGGEKSTISGEREALRGSGRSRDEVKNFWKMLAQRELPTKEHLSSKDISQEGSERLDAIDTIKRFALFSKTVKKKLENRAFPSTSMVATAPFIETLLTVQLDSPALQSWLTTAGSNHLLLPERSIKAIPYLERLAYTHSDRRHESLRLLQLDGDLYFRETFASKRLKEDYNVAENAAEGVAARGRNALRVLLDATDKLNIPRPMPYYAFIQMDGDKMGTILGNVTGKEEHHNISEALSKFSRNTVPSLVQEQYLGRLVYAGGDDVVALASLARNETQKSQTIKTVLNLVDQLQRHYREAVSEQVIDEENRKRVTASVGIAIAHHLTSLSYVRTAAKQAEDSAKKQYGRNALVVTVLRRSGEQTRVGCRWHYQDLSKEEQPIPLFTEFYELFKEDMLSPKCVYIFLEEAITLVGVEKAAQQSEIRRVLLRQLSEKGKVKKDRIPILAGYLANLAGAIDKDDKQFQGEGRERAVELHAQGRRYGLVEVLGWLLVMVFLARKELD